MASVAIAIGAFAAYFVAYHTYGKFIARRLFQIRDDRPTPAHKFNDGVDFVPTRAEVLFGHHFTSIAGTGPIVGPALAIIWGWLPALLWVVFGSIFMGAVHDFSTMIVSSRFGGRSIGDVARDVVNARVRFLFLLIIFFVVLIVIAVFCMVIASLFALYPASIIPVWISLPIAMLVGTAVYKGRVNPLGPSIIAVLTIYALILACGFMDMGEMGRALFGWAPTTPLIAWSVVLLIYAFAASVLPVWRLLQPRDYINGHVLFVSLGLLMLGAVVARPDLVAPALDTRPEGAPPMWPMLFVVVACGAISGFHSLVSSGTSSKQLDRERHALPIGFGGMLLEGMLAVMVIIAVGAGIGMARGGGALEGVAAWQARYSSWGAATAMKSSVGAFVDGSANMLSALGIPLKIGASLMAVFVASFAATTLDTATRLQRYVVAELGQAVHFEPLTNKYVATGVAVTTAGALALMKGPQGYGTGGLVLWPLFGSANQLLACLALLVVTVYLKRRGKPVVYTLIPMLFMLVMTGWAMVYNVQEFMSKGKTLLYMISGAIMLLEAWMVVESFIILFGSSRGALLEDDERAAPQEA